MVHSLDRWVGKVAVVTGASSGIGASIAERLVKEGLKVVALARRKEKLDGLAKSLSSAKGKLYPIQADITKEDDILKAFKWVKDNLGPIHILINNAGVMDLSVSLTKGKTEEFKKVFDTNVMGLCIATREAVQDMKANNVDGHIVHINSILGHKVGNYPNMNVYPASKYAVTALTETLRLELVNLKSKIKVTSISPGAVKTELIVNSVPDPSLLGSFPVLESEDVTEAIVYVLSTPPHVQIHELMIKPIGEAM